MFGFIFIQLVVIIITFEFMRQPWEGKEVEFEKILQLQQDKILEDSISMFNLDEESAINRQQNAPATQEEQQQQNIIEM